MRAKMTENAPQQTIFAQKLSKCSSEGGEGTALPIP